LDYGTGGKTKGGRKELAFQRGQTDKEKGSRVKGPTGFGGTGQHIRLRRIKASTKCQGKGGKDRRRGRELYRQKNPEARST